MKSIKLGKYLLGLLLTLLCFGFSNPTKVIPDFSLRNVDQLIFSTNNNPNVKGYMVVFTCNHCPFAKLYTKRLNELNKKYNVLNVPLIAINSMDSLIYADESFANMQSKAKTDSFQFPYLHDTEQQVAKYFNAKHTPTAYVIWKEENKWIIKYSGAIDDNGENPNIAKPVLANAVDDLLSGTKVKEPKTESFGCAIFYRKEK